MSAYYYAAFYIFIDSQHFHNWGHIIPEARGRQLGLGQGGGDILYQRRGVGSWAWGRGGREDRAWHAGTVAREFV